MLGATMLVFALACLHAASAAVAASRSVPSMRSRLAVRRSPAAVRMGAAESATEGGPAKWFAGGQTVGPQAPGQPADKPYTNMIKLNPVEAVKLASGPADKQLLSPLKEEMPVRAEGVRDCGIEPAAGACAVRRVRMPAAAPRCARLCGARGLFRLRLRCGCGCGCSRQRRAAEARGGALRQL